MNAAELQYPHEVLNLGECRIAICQIWDNTEGVISLETDGQTVTCKVSRVMVFSPQRYFMQEQKIFPTERIRVTIMTNQQVSDEYFAGRVIGSPDDLRTVITLEDVDKYLQLIDEIDVYLEQELQEKQEFELLTLLKQTDTQYQTIPAERIADLGFNRLHNGIQTSVFQKMGIIPILERLPIGAQKIATCLQWINEWEGVVQWTENGKPIRCIVKKVMIFSPRKFRLQKRALYPKERVRIIVMTQEELVKKYAFLKNNGDPNDMRVEITLIDFEKYISLSREIRGFLNRELSLVQEKNVWALYRKVNAVYKRIPSERRSEFNLRKWKLGIQNDVRKKLSITKLVQRTISLTAEARYEALRDRIERYEHEITQDFALSFARHLELTHIRNIAQQKLAIHDHSNSNELRNLVERIDRLIKLFES